jgi:hypothetical protein
LKLSGAFAADNSFIFPRTPKKGEFTLNPLSFENLITGKSVLFVFAKRAKKNAEISKAMLKSAEVF